MSTEGSCLFLLSNDPILLPFWHMQANFEAQELAVLLSWIKVLSYVSEHVEMCHVNSTCQAILWWLMEYKAWLKISFHVYITPIWFSLFLLIFITSHCSLLTPALPYVAFAFHLPRLLGLDANKKLSSLVLKSLHCFAKFGLERLRQFPKFPEFWGVGEGEKTN